MAPWKKNSTIASEVAKPVFWYAQMLRANWLMEDPVMDRT